MEAVMIKENDDNAKQISHSKWQVRNVAIKELGKVSSSENAAYIVNVLKDLTPSPIWMQLFGEPLKQVGFIRRNAWKALENQPISEDTIVELFEIGINDSYYEVRAQMYRTIRAHIEQKRFQPKTEMINHIVDRLHNEKNFEVRIACIEMIPHIMNKEQIINTANKIIACKEWRVRESFLDILCKLTENGVFKKDDLDPVLNAFNMGSEYFKPIFLLKEKELN